MIATTAPLTAPNNLPLEAHSQGPVLSATAAVEESMLQVLLQDSSFPTTTMYTCMGWGKGKKLTLIRA